jgi:predicted DNA-binding transcriptional regulator AlpA
MSPLKKPKEAAALLGVSERRLSRWRNENSGPDWVRLGHRSVAYTETALQSFIVANSRQAASEMSA